MGAAEFVVPLPEPPQGKSWLSSCLMPLIKIFQEFLVNHATLFEKLTSKALNICRLGVILHSRTKTVPCMHGGIQIRRIGSSRRWQDSLILLEFLHKFSTMSKSVCHSARFSVLYFPKRSRKSRSGSSERESADFAWGRLTQWMEFSDTGYHWLPKIDFSLPF